MLLVTAPAAHHRLTTVAALKRELGLTGGADDAYLGALVDQASAAVRTWCGRTFALEGMRETVHQLRHAAGGLVLSRWPVTGIDAITIGATVLDPVLTEVDDDAGLLYRLDTSEYRTGWPPGRATIDYRAGYILPDKPGRNLPADLERAAIVQAKAWFLGRDRDPLTRSENVDGAGSTDYFAGTRTDLVPEVEGLLYQFRPILIG